MAVVFVVQSEGGVETVWSDPGKAVEAVGKLSHGAIIAVRPVDSDRPTAESNAALGELDRLLAERRAV